MKTSRAARRTCGAIFDAARPEDDLARIAARVAEPDFWKDQDAAQKVMQRRRRLEDEIELSQQLKTRADDLAVLVEWAEAGEPVLDDLARGLDELSLRVDTGETKKTLGGEHDRKNAIVTIHPGACGTERQRVGTADATPGPRHDHNPVHEEPPSAAVRNAGVSPPPCTTKVAPLT